MFLRPCRRRKNGKTHTYFALVKSHRTPKGSRQKVVAYLGELSAGEQSGRRYHGGQAKLSAKLSNGEQTANGNVPERVRTLFDLPSVDELPQNTNEEAVLVRLKGVRLERLRDFGDVYLGWCAWRLLGLDALLKRLLPRGPAGTAQPAGDQVPAPAPANDDFNRNVVKTFAKNRRKSLRTNATFRQQRNLG